MSDKKNYYVATSIAYVNGSPHVGYAMEMIMGDVLARSARKNYQQIVFSTGTDEHGGKIAEKAKELGKEPQVFADEMSEKFRELAKNLNISNDRFIRTTDAGHKQRAALVWNELENYIYKKNYEGWYCTGCEEFVTESRVKECNGICPDHNRKYEKIKEENYFFKLSGFTSQILEKIQKGEFRIIPDSRKHEIQSVLREGLEDISISRPKDKISWGVPVPGDENQVMYVWFEALLNYITVIGYPEHSDFKAFWPANTQVIGKGILRFHAAIWPGILLALKQELPRNLYVHGYVTVGGQKMSKSLGNSVLPNEIIDKYGADAFRYYFLRHIPSHGDGDFSWERFEDVYNSELANELGNAVSRTMAMISKYQNGVIGDIPSPEHDSAGYYEALKDYRFDKAIECIWEQVRGLNQYIEEEKPWTLAKNNDEDHLREVLAYMVSCLLEIAELLDPIMPETAKKINYIFETGVIRKIEGTLFPKFEAK